MWLLGDFYFEQNDSELNVSAGYFMKFDTQDSRICFILLALDIFQNIRQGYIPLKIKFFVSEILYFFEKSFF